jgi:hypothetical protein
MARFIPIDRWPPSAGLSGSDSDHGHSGHAHHQGLTIGEGYAHVRQRQDGPAVRRYLSLEYRTLPMPPQQIIAVSLRQMGYEAKGPWRKIRFYRRAQAA